MTKQQFDALILKVEKMKSAEGIDLSLDEDLSIAVMHLISLEEHFFFTGAKTGKTEYFDFLGDVRNIRKELLAKMMDVNEGETWCISKHLLGAAMRLIEVGTKLHASGKRAEAEEVFGKAHEAYSLFWALRLKLVDTPKLKEKQWTVGDIVNKLVDCCDEK
ncbi:hypothetical protein A2110_01290 [Candidatus Jorgensenbacteria bacterium GWA1_54_12]|uniref:Uncharacterized protein n=1 Tax=Candidatus Jorgensenbacteria bacterium GWA1_54_12 TaxID=1798468 RepID=A0A1F6BKH9_9BACT|nr:MAG: hypothetical protein A2110_01290 [Candidatus Jorgensenbacteria bacterium GWA1_54_12]